MSNKMKCPMCDNTMRKGTACKCGEFSSTVVGETTPIGKLANTVFVLAMTVLVILMYVVVVRSIV